MVLELFEATIDSVLTLRPATKSTEVANPEKPVVLFIHGYPDDETLWTKNLTPSLLRDYRALLVRLPHYGGLNPKYSKWGFNFGAIAEMVAATIRAHVPEKSGPVHLVTGDWGSMVGLVLQDSFPQLVKSIVLIDVGPVFSFGVPTSEEIRTILGFRYMYILITAFLIAHFVPFIGEPVARYLCGLVFNGFHITELKVHDEDYIKKKFTPFSNYFYFYLHFYMLKRCLERFPSRRAKAWMSTWFHHAQHSSFTEPRSLSNFASTASGTKSFWHHLKSIGLRKLMLSIGFSGKFLKNSTRI
eukprot:TRINITY_DN3058_c0_g1_i1.p1 TRINITY_DN3058_c0_g1~~TRINITY_DN3058_c0_g1_i1.p1  ORF type:complete len:300 (-),score=78.80 TRINITY_DN3058_c0_g1_i1:436-1335(-)